MTNEIKEILYKLKNIHNFDYSETCDNENNIIEKEYDIYLSKKDTDLLLDYITNLQEENNELKQIIDIRECQLEEMQMNKTDYTQVNILEMQLEDYKQRIDKAIKKIEKDAELIDLEDGYNTCMAVIDILRGDE